MISKKSMLPRETGLEMLSLLPAVSAQKRPRETESRFPSAVSAEFPSRCPRGLPLKPGQSPHPVLCLEEADSHGASPGSPVSHVPRNRNEG